MTMKENLILRHNRHISYLQILGGLVIAFIAADIFEFAKIESNLFGVFIFNNFTVSIVLGIIGLIFLRRRLKEIEMQIAKSK